MALRYSASKELPNINLNSKTAHFGRRKKKVKKITWTIKKKKKHRNEDMRHGDVHSQL